MTRSTGCGHNCYYLPLYMSAAAFGCPSKGGVRHNLVLIGTMKD